MTRPAPAIALPRSAHPAPDAPPSAPVPSMQDSSRWLPIAEAERPFWAGVDLGGTNIKVGLVDDRGRTLAFHTEKTLVENGPDDVCLRMGKGVLEVARLAGARVADIPRVGLGTPGPQDLKRGFIISAGNFPRFDGYNVRDVVSRHAGLPVTFANDATAAGFGEHWIGAGRGKPSLLLLTLGTGVGGSIVLGETTLDGEHSHASECGHIIVDPSPGARKCPCGRPGHLEAYSSAKSIVAMVDEAIAAGRSPALAAAREAALAAEEEFSTKDIGRVAGAGDATARAILDEAARWLGIGITTLLHTLDPAIVLLGGAMTFGGENDPVGRAFIERVRAEVRARAFAILAEGTPIEYASLGGDAGYVGAAGMARAEHHRLHPHTT